MLSYAFQHSHTSQIAGIRCHTAGLVLLSWVLLVFYLKKKKVKKLPTEYGTEHSCCCSHHID